MEHRSFEQLHAAATVTASAPPPTGRAERLRRWADLLECEPNRRFPTLHRLEFALRSERRGLREEGSAIELALADPILRTGGLEDNTYGAARDFFGLSERQAHRLLCSCLNGPAIEGHRMAARLRTMAQPRLGPWFSFVQAWRSGLSLLRPDRPTA